ncbi:ATP/GTP-binding protein [Olleya sp. ITB9]|uniref:AAA family ATPase n=1 Tax=Olleya sp. ITB9 TaxID=1715648 RepID=UPI0006D1C1E2|nr:ATP-binding protein [Olleya sp. ITB9]
MILNIKLKNYRSYKDEVIYTLEASSSKAKDFNYFEINDFKVLKTSLMYGANASGKSNIVRAFFELRNLIIKKPAVDDSLLIYDPFKFNKETNTSPVEITIEFLIDSIKYKYVTKIEHKNVLEESLCYYPQKREVVLFERHTETDKNIQKGFLGDKFGKKEITVFKNQLLLSKFGVDEPHEVISDVYLYFKKMYVYNTTNKIHYELLNDKVSEDLLENETLKFKLEKLINYADTKITGININKKGESPERKIDYLWKKSDFYISGVHDLYDGNNLIGTTNLSLLEESVGTQSLFVLGAKIIEALEDGSVLIIDELDTSLHSFITKMIVMLFQDPDINKNRAQLIFTTHDISLLDKDLIRKDQVWITEKSEKGETDLYSLQDFENLREDTSFDKWYLSGKFGGVPQIKSLKEFF